MKQLLLLNCLFLDRMKTHPISQLRTAHIPLFLTLIFLWTGGFSQTTTTFNFTGGVQTYTVPPCVTELQIVAAGAEGGGPNGGNGAIVSGVIAVTPGQVLEVYVGGLGACPGAGFNGGGQGTNAAGAGNGGCGGGGASDVRIAPYGLGNRVIVAGGGGGMGGGNTDAIGGVGGCPVGTSGNSPFGQGGFGASTTAGGNGGPPWIAGGGTGLAGSLGNGGAGGTDLCFNLGPGGGGGGGLYGGGGGGSDCFGSGSLGGGGGGGGSSLIPGGGACNQGANTGNGYVTITPNNVGMILSVTPAAPVICEGEQVDITVSGGLTYIWEPSIGLSSDTDSVVTAAPEATQTYLITASDGDDCTDTISVTVTVVPLPEVLITPENPAICPGESIELSASGANSFTWSPANGLSETQSAVVSASPAATQTYTVTGTSGTCENDTTITVTVYELPQLETAPQNPGLCPGGSVEISVSGASSYTWFPETGIDNPSDSVVTASPDATTTYTISGTDSNGCVNTAEVTATVLPLPDVDAGDDLEICPNTPISLNGTSIDAVTFSWSPAATLDDAQSEDPVATPNTTTTYTLEVTDINGCTNSDEVTITVIDEDFETIIEAFICEGEDYELPDGTVVADEGNYEIMYTSVLGCDSLVITELTVGTIYNLEEDVNICEGETYTLPDGTSVDADGEYISSLQTVAGCDSIITTTLTVNPNESTTINETICEGQTYGLPDGTTASQSGTYVFDLNTAAGCDSTVTINLTVIETVTIELNAEICENQNYELPDGSVVNEEGIYEVGAGTGLCDTIYIVDVVVFPTYDIVIDAEVCAGESYTMPDGSTESAIGSYVFDYTTINGCDSTVTVELAVLPTSESNIQINICAGESYTLPDGNEVNTTGAYPQLYSNVNGCDSTVFYNVTVRPHYDIDQQVILCESGGYTDPFGNVLTSEGLYTFELNSIFGCDSVINLNLTISNTFTATVKDSICEGEQYVTYNGQIITQSGIYPNVFQSSNGCDSIYFFDITVLPKPAASFGASPRFSGVYDGPVQFFDTSTGADSIEWDFGVFGTSSELFPVIDFQGVPGFYPVCLYATNEWGCLDRQCSEYEVREDFVVYIPSAFSPNGDGINDLFFIQGKGIDPENFHLQIFNRWGELVFETRDLNEKWNGSSQKNTHYSENEVFVYRVIAGAEATQETKEFNGTVTVVR